MLHQSIIDCVADKQQESVSFSSGGKKSEIGVLCAGVLERAPRGRQTAEVFL